MKTILEYQQWTVKTSLRSTNGGETALWRSSEICMYNLFSLFTRAHIYFQTHPFEGLSCWLLSHLNLWFRVGSERAQLMPTWCLIIRWYKIRVAHSRLWKQNLLLLSRPSLRILGMILCICYTTFSIVPCSIPFTYIQYWIKTPLMAQAARLLATFSEAIVEPFSMESSSNLEVFHVASWLDDGYTPKYKANHLQVPKVIYLSLFPCLVLARSGRLNLHLHLYFNMLTLSTEKHFTDLLISQLLFAHILTRPQNNWESFLR